MRKDGGGHASLGVLMTIISPSAVASPKKRGLFFLVDRGAV